MLKNRASGTSRAPSPTNDVTILCMGDLCAAL
nr:MAG TPA: hypothetical protein [Caudoviricetes sp.]DAO71828.1 MAG TPA: hypothetical protein [Caudoviricetes sp.]